MLLKSISYKDFRPFKGNQYIDLTPKDDNKDATVTVIIGNNTYGKSTFVLSFIWCLYGESRFNRPNDILNKKVEKELDVNEKATASVEVVFEDGGKEYTMKRVQEFKKTEKGLKASESEASLVYVDENGQTQKVGPMQHDVNMTIKSILPQDLSTFFFFEGEKDNEISKKDLGKAVRTLLGLEAFDKMRSHLYGSQTQKTPYSNSVMGYYLEKQKSESGDKAQVEWEKKQKAEKELKKATDRIVELDSEIGKYESLIDEINAKLRDAGPAKVLQKRRDNIAIDISSYEKELDRKNKSFLLLFGKEGVPLFVTPLLTRAEEKLDKMNVADKGIKGIEAKAIRELLHRGECLCGTDLKEGSLAYKNVEKYIDYVPPKSIGTLVRDLKETISINRESNKEFVKKYEDEYREIQVLKKRLRDLDAEDRSILARISQIGEIDLGNAEEDLIRYKGYISEFREERDTQIGIKNSKESEIETATNNFNMYKSKTDKAKQYQLYYRYAEEIYKWVNSNYSKKDEELRVRLATNVSNLFDNMYDGKRDITIDEKYAIHMTAEGEVVDTTGGLRVIQYFAYVGGLVKLAYEIMNERHNSGEEASTAMGEQYPLVLDAAFSHADDVHTHNIARELSVATKQLIFALMKKDWLYAKSGLTGKVGRMYELVKIDETEVRVEVYGGDK